jgi:hypothetical protein
MVRGFLGGVLLALRLMPAINSGAATVIQPISIALPSGHRTNSSPTPTVSTWVAVLIANGRRIDDFLGMAEAHHDPVASLRRAQQAVVILSKFFADRDE